MKTLSDQEIASKLAGLESGWSLDGSKLEKVFKFDDFISSLRFANEIGRIAEEMNHHPDLEISWGKLGFSVTTHDAGGLTEKDFDIARSADEAYKDGS